MFKKALQTVKNVTSATVSGVINGTKALVNTVEKELVEFKENGDRVLMNAALRREQARKEREAKELAEKAEKEKLVGTAEVLKQVKSEAMKAIENTLTKLSKNLVSAPKKEKQKTEQQ